MSLHYLMPIRSLRSVNLPVNLPSSSKNITIPVNQQPSKDNQASQRYSDKPANQLYSDKLVSPLCMDNQVSQQYMGRVGSQQYMGRVGSQQYMDNQVNQLSSVNILLSQLSLDMILLMVDTHQLVNPLSFSKNITKLITIITWRRTNQLQSHLNLHISILGDLLLCTLLHQPLILQSSQPPNLLLPFKDCNESEVVTPYILNRRDNHIIFPAKSLSTASVYRHEVPSFL